MSNVIDIHPGDESIILRIHGVKREEENSDLLTIAYMKGFEEGKDFIKNQLKNKERRVEHPYSMYKNFPFEKEDDELAS